MAISRTWRRGLPDAGAHLILVGLPGAGKSTLGRAVAERLRRAFIDFDDVIAREAGCSIADLFARDGEPAFRVRELELTQRARAWEQRVLAPGGGWVTASGAVALLRPPGFIIHLRVSPEAAIARLGGAVAARPLLMQRAEPLAELRRLAVARAPLYDAVADAVLDTETADLQELARRMAELAPLSGQA